MTNPEPPRADAGYEKKDANIRAIALTAVVSIVVVVLIIIALNSFFVSTQEEIYQQQVLQRVSRDLIELRAVEDSILTTYELLDPEQGIYRIPITRAMELMVEESPGTPASQ